MDYLYWKFCTMPNYIENSKMLAFEKAWFYLDPDSLLEKEGKILIKEETALKAH
jgi:hypothetical protein